MGVFLVDSYRRIRYYRRRTGIGEGGGRLGNEFGLFDLDYQAALRNQVRIFCWQSFRNLENQVLGTDNATSGSAVISNRVGGVPHWVSR